jgi:ABC-type phosphate transport system substrate-binding protein
MKKYIILLLGMVFACVTIQAQSFKVIVNNSNSSTSLSKKEISDFFLKKKTKWADGQKVVPIDQKAKSDARKGFTDGVHKKSVSAIKSYWQQAVFAGKGTPPTEKPSDEEVIKYVSQNSGAIGYVSSAADISGVKQLTVSD